MKTILPPPTIVYLPSVGAGYGLGNLIRCLTMIEFSKGSFDSILAIPDNIRERLADIIPQEVRVVEPHAVADMANELAWIVDDYQGPHDGREFFRQIKSANPRLPICALDYFYPDHPGLDLVVNLGPHLETKVLADGAEYKQGLEYGIIRPVFFKYRSDADASPSARRVLITFGGEDAADWTTTSLQWLEKNAEQDLDVTIIVGTLNANGKTIERAASQSRHAVEIFDHVNNVEEHMHACDLAFCGGGTTILELAFLGKSVIALPQHQMERSFLQSFEKKGFLMPGAEKAIRQGAAAPCAELLSDPDLREAIRRKGMQLVDGKGPDRIVNLLIDKIQPAK